MSLGTRTSLALAALCALVSAAAAQETGGTISGRIIDPQGGALPGVSVTLRSEATNAAWNATTSGQGSYLIPFVPIGHYTLTATLEGFTAAKQADIEVRVGDNLRIDVTLQLGAMTEAVTVTSGQPLLETGSASRGQVINREQVQDLPLLGRNPFMLSQHAAGVQYTPTLASRSNRPFDNGGMDNFSINGGRAFTNEFLLDGVPNTGTETNQPGNLSFVPSPDATAEFKVQTNIYDAQYGRTGGGVVNVVLKSGTNDFHGAVYEYYRDEHLNANTFDANRQGQGKEGLYWSQPGATLDGPVKIPGLYDGTNRTFFMYSWEQIRSEVPFPQVWTVPTDAERRGDFSRTRTADGRPVTIYDPLTTQNVDGQYVREAFRGNVIPTERMNPAALSLLERVPSPNVPGQVDNFLAPETSRGDRYDQHVLKIDQVLSADHRFFARLVRNKRTEINDYGGFAPEASPFYTHGRMNVGVAAEATSVLSPSLVLSSRVGFIRHDFYIQRFSDGYDPAALGFPTSLAAQLPRPTFPRVEIEDYSEFGWAGSVFTQSDTWSWSETLSKTAGEHSLKLGGELRVMLNDQQNPTSSFGTFEFSRGFTQAHPLRADAASGNALASFLLGYPSAGSVPINPDLAYRNHYYGLFLQDDWRVTSKLTLNAGLRWDYESPLTEASNQQNRGFDATADNPFEVPGIALEGGLLFTDESNRLPYRPDRNNVQPRFGVTYQLTDRAVLRGGYGISYLPTFDTGFNNGFSLSTPLVASVDGGITPAARLDNPYPNGIDQPVGSSQGLATLVGRGFTYGNPDRVIPHVHQFSFGVQHELPGRLVVDVSYVGSRTRGLPVTKGINEVSAADLTMGGALLDPVSNPFEGLLPGTELNEATVPRQQLLRPFPQFTGITEEKRSIGRADYDALQLRLEKRLSRGLQFLVSYTFSKSMEEVGYLNAQDDWDQLARVVAERDAPHRLLVSATYELPFFPDGGGLTGALLGGWQVNAILVGQSGLPIAAPGNAVWTGVDPRLDNPTRGRWFNTCTETLDGARQNCASDDEPVVWQVQEPFTLRTLSSRISQLRTSRPVLVDFSVFKTFDLPGRLRAQVRVEAFNLFNTPWFGSPDMGLTAPGFGQIEPSQENDPRNLQLGVRLTF
ncbi:MAG: TonB-dependent receptor plug domain-containing protein [Luteitalea sp.]|nr:TonB-dependent receptor plug domain-containing protein [Luteitalea sp.]